MNETIKRHTVFVIKYIFSFFLNFFFQAINKNVEEIKYDLLA